MSRTTTDPNALAPSHPAELEPVIHRALAGDTTVLPALKAAFDRYPELTSHFGDLAQLAELAMLAAECLFIDLSEVVEADEILASALADAHAGPARAIALSLRALIRYYHGNANEAAQIGETALKEVGDDPLQRATVLGRVAFLVMQVDLERGLALAEGAVRLLTPEPKDIDPDLIANVVLLRANAEFGLVRGFRHLCRAIPSHRLLPIEM